MSNNIKYDTYNCSFKNILNIVFHTIIKNKQHIGREKNIIYEKKNPHLGLKSVTYVVRKATTIYISQRRYMTTCRSIMTPSMNVLLPYSNTYLIHKRFMRKSSKTVVDTIPRMQPPRTSSYSQSQAHTQNPKYKTTPGIPTRFSNHNNVPRAKTNRELMNNKPKSQLETDKALLYEHHYNRRKMKNEMKEQTNTSQQIVPKKPEILLITDGKEKVGYPIRPVRKTSDDPTVENLSYQGLLDLYAAEFEEQTKYNLIIEQMNKEKEREKAEIHAKTKSQQEPISSEVIVIKEKEPEISPIIQVDPIIPVTPVELSNISINTCYQEIESPNITPIFEEVIPTTNMDTITYIPITSFSLDFHEKTKIITLTNNQYTTNIAILGSDEKQKILEGLMLDDFLELRRLQTELSQLPPDDQLTSLQIAKKKELNAEREKLMEKASETYYQNITQVNEQIERYSQKKYIKGISKGASLIVEKVLEESSDIKLESTVISENRKAHSAIQAIVNVLQDSGELLTEAQLIQFGRHSGAINNQDEFDKENKKIHKKVQSDSLDLQIYHIMQQDKEFYYDLTTFNKAEQETIKNYVYSNIKNKNISLYVIDHNMNEAVFREQNLLSKYISNKKALSQLLESGHITHAFIGTDIELSKGSKEIIGWAFLTSSSDNGALLLDNKQQLIDNSSKKQYIVFLPHFVLLSDYHKRHQETDAYLSKPCHLTNPPKSLLDCIQEPTLSHYDSLSTQPLYHPLIIDRPRFQKAFSSYLHNLTLSLDKAYNDLLAQRPGKLEKKHQADLIIQKKNQLVSAFPDIFKPIQLDILLVKNQLDDLEYKLNKKENQNRKDEAQKRRDNNPQDEAIYQKNMKQQQKKNNENNTKT